MGLIKLAAKHLDNEWMDLIDEEDKIRRKHSDRVNTHYGAGALLGAGIGAGLGAITKNPGVAMAGGLVGSILGMAGAGIHHNYKTHKSIQSSKDAVRYNKNVERQEKISNYMFHRNSVTTPYYY